MVNMRQETRRQIEQFAKEHAQRYLEAAEQTHLEKLRLEAAKAKITQAQKNEAENDLISYMSDYMNDLIMQGTAESDALEKAKRELSVPEAAEQHDDLQERFRSYYEEAETSGKNEAIGLMYGACSVLGMVAGLWIGYINGGGKDAFLQGGWIDTVIGLIVGVLLGTGMGLLMNALIMIPRRKS